MQGLQFLLASHQRALIIAPDLHIGMCIGKLRLRRLAIQQRDSLRCACLRMGGRVFAAPRSLVQCACLRQGRYLILLPEHGGETLVDTQGFGTPSRLCQQDDQALDCCLVGRVNRQQAVQGVDGAGKGLARNTQVRQFQQQPDPIALQRLAPRLYPRDIALLRQIVAAVEQHGLFQQLLGLPWIAAGARLAEQGFEGVGIDP